MHNTINTVKLTQLRKDKGLSQYGMAHELSNINSKPVSQSQYSRYENRKSAPRLDIFVAICAVLQCEPKDILIIPDVPT